MCHVVAIARYLHVDPLLVLTGNGDQKRLEDITHLSLVDLEADQVIEALPGEVDRIRSHGIGVLVIDGTRHLAPCHLGDQIHGTAEGVADLIGIQPSLVAEGGVSIEPVPAGGLADVRGVEGGTLEEHVGRLLSDAGVFPTDHAGNADRIGGIGDHQIPLRKLVLLAVQCGELLTRLSEPDVYLAALDLIEIKGVKRLSDLHEDKVGSIDHIIHRVDAHRLKCLAKPLRRGADLQPAYDHSCIARNSLRGIDM